MKTILTGLLLAMMLLPLSLTANPKDFRYVPGEIKLDLSEPINFAWIWNQQMINDGISDQGHWREATEAEKLAFCGEHDTTVGFAFDPSPGYAMDIECLYDVPGSQLASPMISKACEVFNRRWVRFEPPATLVCSEPIVKNQFEQEKNEKTF